MCRMDEDFEDELPRRRSVQPTGGCVGGCFGVNRRKSVNVQKLAESTRLSQKEVGALYDRFRKIVGPFGYMTRDQFRETLGLIGMTPNSYIPMRMFSVFDQNHDGVLSFEEYVSSFAILLRGSEDERLKLSFRLADSSETGHLGFDDFKLLVCACQSTTTALLEKEEVITDEELRQLFTELCGPNNSTIDLNGYIAGVRSNVRFLELLGISRRTKKNPESKNLTSLVDRLGELRRHLLLGGKGLESFVHELEAIIDTTAAQTTADEPGCKTPEIPSEIPSGRNANSVLPSTPSNPRRGHTLLGPKRGLAVHFGHENWNMVLSMMIGIRLAVGRSSFEIQRPLQSVDFAVKDKFSIVPQLSNFLDSRVSEKIKINRFIDYAPLVFKKLREEISKISEDEYLRSVGPEQLLGNMVLGNLSSLAEQTSEGKGGAFFYYTADAKFVIKTVSKTEKHLLKKMLRSYYEHLKAHPDSLIVRFYGLHGLRLKRFDGMGKLGHSDEEIFFVVMGNLFNTPLEVNRRYDLKGSWVGRTEGARPCTLKDGDFVANGEKIKVSSNFEKTELIRRITTDCEFFVQHNIIDYSLLVGIHQEHDGKSVYYLGIIDILCLWDTRKQLEHFFKSIRYDSHGISAVAPKEYAERFCKFISKHIQPLDDPK